MTDAAFLEPIGPAASTTEPVSTVGQQSQWELMVLRFKRNKLAMTGLIGLIIMYFLVFMGPFLAPNEYMTNNNDYTFGGPSNLTFIGPNGRVGLRPYLYPMTTVLDKKSFTFVNTLDKTKKIPIKFFVKGDPIVLFGFIHTDYHLFGVEKPYRVYLIGADVVGRDLLARVLVGGQVSMTIGLLGVAFSIIFGAVLGTMSGYYMGVADDIIQRIIEVIMSFPTIPLWAVLAAALPPISGDFTPIHRYFLITVVLSLIGWTGLARQLRAKVMAYRSADFIQAALAAGASDSRIIFVHMLPNAASHIIVTAALSIPGMILGETALSFLGLGIVPPMVSWGALMRDAQQVTVIVQHPWLMLAGVAVIIAVLFYSFLGDGIRDAADPYTI
jgi:peptide/nickel transport system permease protein